MVRGASTSLSPNGLGVFLLLPFALSEVEGALAKRTAVYGERGLRLRSARTGLWVSPLFPFALSEVEGALCETARGLW